MSGNRRLCALLAFAMYMLTGAACMVVGSSLSYLVDMYERPLEQVVLLGSAYALGRVTTVYGTGRMVERFGPAKVLAAGTLLISVFLLGISSVPSYGAGLFFALCGGIGMGVQDAVCPPLLSYAYPNAYSSALSAGQAAFGLGNFCLPFLMGVLLAGGLSYLGAYYALLILAAAILLALPFSRISWNPEAKALDSDAGGRGRILLARHKRLAYAALLLESSLYCAVVNTISTYTTSYAAALGATDSEASFMLTAYNIGCFAGSLVFVVVLRHLGDRTVLMANQLAAIVAIAVLMSAQSLAAAFACLFVAGFFLGVLFSVIVAIATKLDFAHISLASSRVATAGGTADILTPAVTGALVSSFGIGASFAFAGAMAVASVTVSGALCALTSESNEGGSS